MVWACFEVRLTIHAPKLPFCVKRREYRGRRDSSRSLNELASDGEAVAKFGDIRTHVQPRLTIDASAAPAHCRLGWRLPQALGNVVQNRVEAAYARSDLFERRRLMDDWAAYLGRPRGRLAD